VEFVGTQGSQIGWGRNNFKHADSPSIGIAIAGSVVELGIQDSGVQTRSLHPSLKYSVLQM
jgi:hypothetical protein